MNSIYAGLITSMVLAIITFVLSMLITVSQLINVVKTKNTSGVSLSTYFLFLVAGLICVAWAVTYYFKLLMENQTGGENGPYWLWQWSVIPILGYYIFDVSISCSLIFVKLRHKIWAKQLNMKEIDLAKYLLNQQKKKLAKAKHKMPYRKYFWMTLYLALIAVAVAIFMPVFAKFVTPQYDKNFNSNKWMFVFVLSVISALAFEAISWPQFITCVRKKDTSGISINWAIFLPVSMTIAFTYALAQALLEGATVPSTIGALVFNGLIINYGILVLKLINRRKARKKGMTEIEYTKKYIIPLVNKKEKERLVKKHAKSR